MAISGSPSKNQPEISWIKHALILSPPIFIALTFFNGSLFGYHPSLLAIGYFVFMAEGIIAAINAKGKQRQFYLNIHYASQVLAAISISMGVFAIYRNKNLMGKSHLLTVHARLGALTLLSSLFVFLGGLPVFYGMPKSLRKLTSQVNRAHKTFGAVAFLGAIITSLSGLQVFNPKHPLHKGYSTYAISLGLAIAGLVTILSTFAFSQLKKSYESQKFE